MSRYLPDHVSENDPKAPWNDPPTKTCSSCGAEMHNKYGHKDDCPQHPKNDSNDSFSQKVCAVCCPPDDIQRRIEQGGPYPFCSSHGRDDLEAKLEHEQEMFEREEKKRSEREYRRSR